MGNSTFCADLDASTEWSNQHLAAYYQDRFHAVSSISTDPKSGYDRIGTVRIEEKISKTPYWLDGKPPECIAIETVSNQRLQTKGWIYHLSADLLLWVVCCPVPYLYEVDGIALKHWWVANGEAYQAEHRSRRIEAHSGSISWRVPIQELREWDVVVTTGDI